MVLEIETSEFLDKEKENLLLVKVMFSDDYSEIIDFVVIYLTSIDEKMKEIIKYDISRKEALNVHYNYLKNKKKIFLKNKKINYETLEEIIDYIKNNWVSLKLKYLKNRNI
jgi:hypothetical protein